MNQKPQLLVISPTFPYPLISGGKLRIYNLLKEISGRFDITLLTLIEDDEDNQENRDALCFVNTLIPVPISQKKSAQIVRMMRYSVHWLLGTPAEVLIKKSLLLETKLRELLVTKQFDFIQFEYIQNAQYLHSTVNIDAPKYLVAHDISFISQERKADVAKGLKKLFWSREARLMKNYELKYWPQFHSVFTMSETDKIQLQMLTDTTNATVIPNGVDTKKLVVIDDTPRPTIVFVGWMRHLPNRDAIEWFIKDIWPIIKKQHGTVQLQIVGKGLPIYLQNLASNDSQITYLGYVENIATCVGSATLSIVPIRIGSGSRLKILESMALGTPVATTTVGCEGINAIPNEEAKFADTPTEFAKAVLELLDNEDIRKTISQRARSLVENQYSWQTIGNTAIDAIIGRENV